MHMLNLSCQEKFTFKDFMRAKRYCTTLILILCCVYAFSQERVTEKKVVFRKMSSVIDTSYSDNAAQIREMESYLHNISRNKSVKIIGVKFSGATSPEGTDRFNNALAGKRCQTLEELFRSMVSIPDNLITRQNEDIQWNYLRSLVEQSDLPQKDKILAIIDGNPEKRKQSLMRLEGGKVWQRLNGQFFNFMRNATVSVCTTIEQIPAVGDGFRYTPITLPELQKPAMKKAQETEPDPFYFSLKTNMLYDVAAIPNIGAEFHLGGKWSLAANWHYAWWKTDRVHWYWRTYGGDLAVRRWFGRQNSEHPLAGHHVGLYGQMITYDFELGNEGILADPWCWAVGLEYGYSLPVGRKLNIDFTLGAGYHWGEYKEYLPIDGHYVWQATKMRKYLGPTKAEVSLVWLIGRNNYNKNKGGRR